MDRLTRLLADDGTVVTAWVGMPGRHWVEAIAAAPFDAVTLDMQHGTHGEEGALAAVASIAATGKPALLRIPVGRFDLASRALDAGCHAVIAPMINSAQDARAFAASMKYPPVGERSYGPTVAVRALGLAGAGDYVPRANADTLALAMIETREAFDALDAILAVEGIDGVFMGPADFSVSIQGGGMPTPFGDETLPMIEAIAERARGAGKLAAAFAHTPEAANRAHAMGYRLIAAGLDAMYLRQGIDPILGALDFRG